MHPRPTSVGFGVSYKVEPFTILKALYPTGQAARLGKLVISLETRIPRRSSPEKYLNTVEFFATVERLENVGCLETVE